MLNSTKEEHGPTGKHKKKKAWNDSDDAGSKTAEEVKKVAEAGGGIES